MSKDYVHRSSPRKVENWRDQRADSKPQKRHPWLIIIILLILAGAGFAGWKWYFGQQPAKKNSNHKINIAKVATTESPSSKKLATTSTEPAKDDPLKADIKFDFYNELPKTSVQVAIDTKTSTANKSNEFYVLQMGSFTDKEAADKLRKQIAQHGFVVRVVNYSREAEQLHRVQMGPYFSSKQAKKHQQELQNKNIPSILLKMERNKTNG